MLSEKLDMFVGLRNSGLLNLRFDACNFMRTPSIPSDK